MLISSSSLPGLGRVSAKNVNKLTDFNAAVSDMVDVRRELKKSCVKVGIDAETESAVSRDERDGASSCWQY